MVKHNNVIPNGHLKKDCQNHVKTSFNQPACKTRRRLGEYTPPLAQTRRRSKNPVIVDRPHLTSQPAKPGEDLVTRQKKAVKIFPRPTAGSLRPIIHGQTLKYNMKLSAGRGFSLEELQAAGIPQKLAPTIGISVDHWRRNRSLEGLRTNVQRLKAYKEKLVVFPRHAHKFKAGDSTPGDTQVQQACMPIVREKKTVDLVKVTNEMKSFKAYEKLHIERTNQRHLGARLKKAAKEEK